MIRLGRWQVSIEGLLALGLLVALSLGGIRCSAYRQGGDDARLAVLEQNAHKASLAGIRSRAVTDSVIRKVDSVTREVTNRIASNRKVEARLLETLAANDSLLADSSRSAIEGRATELFVALQRTTEVARLFRDSTEVLLTGVAILVSAHEAERSAWLAERESNTNLLAAKNNLIAALEARECRVLWRIPCPSRTQTFVGGVVVGVLTLAVAR
jgi:hypothetical protein